MPRTQHTSSAAASAATPSPAKPSLPALDKRVNRPPEHSGAVGHPCLSLPTSTTLPAVQLAPGPQTQQPGLWSVSSPSHLEPNGAGIVGDWVDGTGVLAGDAVGGAAVVGGSVVGRCEGVSVGPEVVGATVVGVGARVAVGDGVV